MIKINYETKRELKFRIKERERDKMRKKGLALLLAIGLLAANIAGCGNSLQDGDG